MITTHEYLTILTEKENDVMHHLVSAYNLFNEITMEDQQSANDLFDFGHYLDAAQNTLLVRAARRLEPALLKHDDSKKEETNEQEEGI